MTTEIPPTMFAWRKHMGTSEPKWEEVPVPECPPKGFLVKILASGVCRSDHSILHDEKPRPWFQQKFTLGHEGCGRIVKVGDEVTDGKFQVGNIIALDAVPGCGEKSCPECGRGVDVLCELCHHAGIGQDGFHAPYCAVPYRSAVLVPENVTPAQAAVACDAVKTGYHAIVRRGEVKKEELVFQFGLGGLGFNALQVVRHIGARVIVADVKQEILDEAEKLGVPKTDIVPVGKDVREFVKAAGLEGKIDTVLDFVGTHQTFADSQAIVRRGGKIVNVGTFDLENTVDMKNGIRKRLTFLFSYGGLTEDLEAVLGLIKDGVIQPVVEERGPSDFPAILQGLMDGTINGRMALKWE